MEQRQSSDSRLTTDESRLRELVAQVLAEAKRQGASDAEASVSVSQGLSVNVRLGEVETVEHNRDKGLAVTLFVGQKSGSASTTDFTPAGVRDCVRAAATIARYTGADEHAGLADPEQLARELPDLDLYHPWNPSVERAIELARECVLRVRLYGISHLHARLSFRRDHDERGQPPGHRQGKVHGLRKVRGGLPETVIEIGQASKAVLISCHSRDKDLDVKKKCQVGCIACGICVRTCPVDAIKIDNNLARIDHNKCINCGLCVKKCPTNAIHDYLSPRMKALIHAEKCAGIDVCAKVCPVNAISGDVRAVHRVDQSKCIGCGMCEARCPKKAISMVPTSGSAAAKPAEKEMAAV